MNNTAIGRGLHIRWKLLLTVSAAALLASAHISRADDDDSDRPLIWIDLTGQLERLDGSQEKFSPSFMDAFTIPAHVHALDVQHPPPFSIDDGAKITFQPEDSSWFFSGAVQIGRASANFHRHQQTKNPNVQYHFHFSKYNISKDLTGSLYPSRHVKEADGQSHYDETHAVVDFQAGKDVGLGRLNASSVISGGIRFAQFSSKSDVTLRGEPDVHYPSGPLTSVTAWAHFKYERPALVFHDYAGHIESSRSFHGVGPSLTWNASLPVAGAAAHGGLNLDWGFNGALLFGRQKVSGNHQTTGKSYKLVNFQNNFNGGHGYDRVGYFTPQAPYAVHPNGANFDRERSVIAPNLGGTLGLSFTYSAARISIGYRADLFFNAMDEGIDKRRSETVGFYGPFAGISVGMGG